jgi:phage N-6-adenine-methyltransferase
MIQARLFTTEQTETTSDDYYTPKWIFDTLGLHFDLDVASPPGGPPFVPCDNFYTQADDGLAQEWHGRVWMNPPFSNPTPWVQRWLQHANGIALLPTSNGKWFRNLWNEEVKWVALPYNLKFIAGDGRKLNTMPLPCWVIGVGSDNIEALHNFGKVR